MPLPEWMQQYNDLNLFDDMRHTPRELNQALSKVVVGQFYEVLATKIYGAQPAGIFTDDKVHPDVIVWGKKKGDKVYEIKGGSEGKGCVLDTGQLEFYRELEKTDFPYTNPKVSYTLFLHTIKKIDGVHLTTTDLIKQLCKSTLCAIEMPLPFVETLLKVLPIKMYTAGFGYGSRGGVDHPSFLRIPASLIKKWVLFPETVEQSLKDYAKESLSEFSMNGWRMKKRTIYGKEVIGEAVNNFSLLTIQGN